MEEENFNYEELMEEIWKTMKQEKYQNTDLSRQKIKMLYYIVKVFDFEIKKKKEVVSMWENEKNNKIRPQIEECKERCQKGSGDSVYNLVLSLAS